MSTKTHLTRPLAKRAKQELITICIDKPVAKTTAVPEITLLPINAPVWFAPLASTKTKTISLIARPTAVLVHTLPQPKPRVLLVPVANGKMKLINPRAKTAAMASSMVKQEQLNRLVAKIV